MEWLNFRQNFSDGDLILLDFDVDAPLCVHTARVWRDQQDGFQFGLERHDSEAVYLQWLDKIKSPPSQGSTLGPGIFVVMHPLLPDGNGNYMEIGYRKETFKKASQLLVQHRSIIDVTSRASTAIITAKTLMWEDHADLGPAIVYNCKSDDVSPVGPANIAMSVTCFPQASLTFAMLYGCTKDVVEDVSEFLEMSKKWGTAHHHPLILPMIFAELERRRLLEQLGLRQGQLSQRIMDLKNQLREEHTDVMDNDVDGLRTKLNNASNGQGWFVFWRGSMNSRRRSHSSDSDKPTSFGVNECEAAEVWIQVSKLKNGLQSFRAQLKGLLEHSKELSKTLLASQPQASGGAYISSEMAKTGQRAEARIERMVTELECEIRNSESILNGMVMATQVEWNYHTRRDANATIIIARRTKLDSSQMKTISRLGMIFLPGTFLATVFSMSFFNWIPENSNQVVSPWIAVYFILFLITTGVTLRFGHIMSKEERVQEDLESGLGSDKSSV